MTTTLTTIFAGDEGTTLQVTVLDNGSAKDISAATTKQVKFSKPGGSNIAKDMDFVTDGTDGLLAYVFEADLIDTIGKWVSQVYLELPAGKWHTTVFEFMVKATIEIS